MVAPKNMQNSAYMDRSVPPYINVRSVPTCANYINKQFVCAQYLRKINDLNLGRRCSTLPTAKHIIRQQKNRLGVRVYVLSDLHTDYPANMAWVQRLSTTTYKRDILIVAGDVAEKFKNFVLTMLFLKERFRHVFFVPGNHDVWCRSKQEPYVDSVEKLGALMEACSDLEVATEPKIIDGVGIIPLFSWYHQSFDKEQDITGLRIPSLKMACKDFHACKWPSTLSSSDLSLAKYFDEMNFKKFEVIREIQETSCQVITFSHFLPRSELCPEKRMLFYPNLPKVIGSDLLEASLRKIHGPNGNPSACHVFGHTHFCWDSVLDGIRYIQAPLAYPRVVKSGKHICREVIASKSICGREGQHCEPKAMLVYSASLGLRPALGAFSLTRLVACHGIKGLKRFKFFTTVSSTGSIPVPDKQLHRCYFLRRGNYSACRAKLRAGRVRFSSSFPATDEVDWTDSTGEKKLAVEVSRESVAGVQHEEHSKYIPVKAFFLSTSVDLKSLQVEHFFDIVPPATRNANYAILKYSNTLQHHTSHVPVNDTEKRRESWSNCHYMVVFQYGSVVLFNIADHEEEQYLQIAKKYASGLLSEARKDDYAVVEKPSLETWMQAGPDYIVLQRFDIDGIRIIGSVLGQSIALDHFVRQVDGMVAEFTDLNRRMEKTGTFTMKQEKLFQLVGKANSNLADVILKLGLFERSDIAWKNANYAQIWEYLRDEYELTQRFGSLDFKLKFVEHNVRYFLEILQNRKSDFLEWLIIILISAEIVIAIYNIVRETV